jgi:hypothetical protein
VGALGLLGGPWAAAIAGGTAAFGAEHPEEAATTIDLVTKGLGALPTIIEPTLDVFQSLSSVIGDMFAAALPVAGYWFNILAEAAAGLWNGLMVVAKYLIEVLRPGATLLVEVLSFGARVIGDVFLIGIRAAGYALSWIGDKVAPYFSSALEAVRSFGNFLIDFVHKLGFKWEGWVNASLPKEMQVGFGESWWAKIKAENDFDKFAAEKKKREEADKVRAAELAKEAQKAKTQVNATNIFNIQQKFDEHFDPDRVLTAFRSDVNQRGKFAVESGLTPLFVPL